MRIFLSYARERLSEAQQVDAALEAEGHEVFFARDSIAAGSQFGRAIRDAVAGSDLFVFFVSPESVEPGSYCLTELGFARERWARPADRILPVVLAQMPPEGFPPGIQSLSALYPTGNLAAEVVACVEAIARTRRRARLRAAGVALAAIFAVASVGAAVWRGRNGEPRPFLDVVAVTDPRPAVAGMPALVEMSAHIENPLPHIDSIVGLALELDDARAELEGEFQPILLDPYGGQNYFQWFRILPRGDSLVTPGRWRACVRHANVRGQTCGDWSDWDAGPLVDAVPLTADQRSRARAVAATPGAFLVGLASPHQLMVLPSDGSSPSAVALPGEPTAIAVAGDRVAVGTRAPGAVVLLGPEGQRSEHRVPTGRVGGSEASTGVASVALTEREAWVITGGPDGDPSVRLLDLGAGRWVALSYAGDTFKFDARGMRLRAGPSGVWAVPTATTPSSLYRLSRARVEEIRGHDVPAVSCTGDLAPRTDSTLRVVTCDGGLLIGRPGPAGFTAVGEENLRLFPFTKGDWRTELLASTGDTVAVAITVLRNDPERTDQMPLVGRVSWVLPGSDRARIGFERDSVAVTSLAVRDSLALATVTSARGVRDLVAAPLRPR